MQYYVNAQTRRSGDGTKERPFKTISEAAALLAAGPGSRLVVEKTAAECVTVALAEVLNG